MLLCAGENWNTVMYDGMRTTGTPAAFYFLLIVILGNYVVLNLFLAILLDKFAGGDEDDKRKAVDTDEAMQQVADMAEPGAAQPSPRSPRSMRMAKEAAARAKFMLNFHVRACRLSCHARDPVPGALLCLCHACACTTADLLDSKFRGLPPGTLCREIQRAALMQALVKGLLDKVLQERSRRSKKNQVTASPGGDEDIPANVQAAMEGAIEQDDVEDALEGKALGIFGPKNPLRMLCAWAVWQPQFEQIIIVLIFLSSITLALDSPRLDPDGQLKAALVRCSPNPGLL